ncbi:hypothetical protein [Flavobacterium sp.]|uniref:hypothetical protein n=1 Tax=Flavobacterium sp. TaxID=239 RepID=UPI003266B405
MENSEVVQNLIHSFGSQNWFDSVAIDGNRLVVYVHQMSFDILTAIPSSIEGKQVLVHFVRPKQNIYSTVILNQSNINTEEDLVPDSVRFEDPVITISDDTEEDLDEADLVLLQDELGQLQEQCGGNILVDIFYEIHDGNNSLTNLSIRFPEVRLQLQELYDEYGFDVLHEELDS